MDYLIYDTYSPETFFLRVANYFLDSFIRELPSSNTVNTVMASSEFTDFKIFICKSENYHCTVNNKAVILNNVQVKFFLKACDKKYKKIDKKNLDISLSFQAKFFNPSSLHFYDYIKIVQESGEIADGVPLMNNYNKSTSNSYKVTNYNKITDRQTDAAFFEGIANSIKKGDTVRFITDKNATQRYMSLLNICREKINQDKIAFYHCSKTAKPNCEFLREVG